MSSPDCGAESGQLRPGWPPESTYNADVYVFAVHTSKHHHEYDPLDVRQWRFFVVARRAIEQRGYESLGLATLESLAG
ncbi:MAG: hypothetical protein IPL43_11565 [Micropruina sp.]|nr:hypothetical protein [Micropruina sp.]